MSPLSPDKKIATGIDRLDRIVDGIYIGDNVVWYDESGNLAIGFWKKFIEESLKKKKPVIFISFDRSPKNLFERLGAMGKNPNLTVLDCFTHGKGMGAEAFQAFLKTAPEKIKKRVKVVENPADLDVFNEALYSAHAKLSGDVRLVFESLTGMQEVWGGESQVASFYAHSCPRLYDLSTIAYWVMEKGAHSSRLRAQINQVAQVAMELGIKRGTSTLTVIKAEGRQPEKLQQPHLYHTRGAQLTFPGEKDVPASLGARIRHLRVQRGFSQAQLAKQVGVTPSTISQVESNTIYPSIPGLLKMAEILSVDPGVFFSQEKEDETPAVFSGETSVPAKLLHLSPDQGSARLLTPTGFPGQVETWVIELTPGAEIAGHFFQHKDPEMGFVLSGKVQFLLDDIPKEAEAGDMIYLDSRMPSRWSNLLDEPARMVWTRIRQPA